MAMSAGRVLSHGPGRVFFGSLLPVVIRCGGDTPPPVALRDVTWHACNMLAALSHVQVRITERRAGGSAEFDCDCLHSLLLDATLLRQALPRFAGTIPEHAIALAACRDRVSWLMNLITLSDLQQRPPGLSDWQSAKLNAETILARLDGAPAWPFASLGVEEMSERVRAEAMRTEAPAVAISQQDADALGVGKALELFRVLLDGKPHSYDVLARECWPDKAPDDDTIGRALRRMETKLLDHGRPWLVTTSNPASISRRMHFGQ